MEKSEFTRLNICRGSEEGTLHIRRVGDMPVGMDWSELVCVGER